MSNTIDILEDIKSDLLQMLEHHQIGQIKVDFPLMIEEEIEKIDHIISGFAEQN